MQTRYWDFSEIDSTEYMNLVLHALVRDHNVGAVASAVSRPGRLTGFIATANSPADDSIDLERGGYPVQIVLTEPGTIVIEDDDLDDAVTFDLVEANPRIDLVAIKHEQRNVLPNVAARYVVIKGTAAASPVPPYSGLQLDETALAEIWIDTAPGTGNPPEIAASHIRIMPTCLGLLVSDNEKTWGKTNNADGDAGIWSRFGYNDDRFYMMRNPEEDREVLMVLNAYFDPVTGKWYQEDITRRSALAIIGEYSSAFAIYKADAGTTGDVFATFWEQMLRLSNTTGNLIFNNNLEDYTLRFNLETNASVLTSTGTTRYPAIARTAQGYVGVAYISSGIKFKRANPGSKSFGSEYTVEPITTGLDAPDLISLGGEKLLCSYVRSGAVYTRTSTTGGTSWGSPITVYSTGIATIRAGLTRISTGKIFCAFVTTEDANDSIKILESTDDGATWVNKQVVYAGGGPDLRSPLLITLPNDVIACVFNNYTTSALMITLSNDEGVSWSALYTIETGVTIQRDFNLFYDPLREELYALYLYSSDWYYRKSDTFLLWDQDRRFLWGNDANMEGVDMTLAKSGDLFLVYSVTDDLDVLYVTGYAPIVATGQ